MSSYARYAVSDIELMHRKIDLSQLNLQQRLLALLFFPLIIVTTTSLVIDYQIAKRTATQAFDNTLLDTLYDVQEHLQHEALIGNLEFQRSLKALSHSHEPDQLFIAIRDRHGLLKIGEGDLSTAPPPEQGEPIISDARYREQAVRIATQSINIPSFKGYIIVAQTTYRREKSLQQILTAMLWPNLVSVIITLFVILTGIKLGLRPLIHLENQIAHRSINDLNAIELSNCPAELRSMMERLNQLFYLLNDATTRQQRFIADAAHQMRTPLTALQSQLDLAANEAIFTAHQERLQQLQACTSRLNRLLSQLLIYAKAEKISQLTNHFESIALHQLIEKNASQFLDMALPRNIDLGFELQPTTITGLPWMLQELLSNLIDNAIRYTPPGGSVTVRCAPNILEVEDSGPGIAPEHQELVFERFYHIAGAASSGCGLGLAIVKQIAELHGATIQLSNITPHGARFTIRFTSTNEVYA